MSSLTDWLAYCLAKPGAWRDSPWEGDVVAKVGPKIFAFLGPISATTTLGLSCGDRETADLWLERYPGAARKMAYLGRYGWNTFDVGGAIPDDELAELVDASYARVVARLPRRLRPEGWSEVRPGSVPEQPSSGSGSPPARSSPPDQSDVL